MANPILYPLNYALGNNKAQGFPRVQYAKITEMIDSINKITAGTITLTDVELGDGTVALPSLTFAADLNTGIYRIGADNIGIALGGAQYVDFSTSRALFHDEVWATKFDARSAATLTIGGTNATAITITPATTVTGLLTTSALIRNSAGTVGAPAFSFTAQTDMGLYKISSTQLGAAVSGALVGGFNTTGLFTGAISEQTTGSGITLKQNIVRQNTLAALNSTGTVTAAMINAGGITSTSAAGVTATLDTAANIGTQIGATNGTSIEFIVDNTAGANTVTVAVSAGITAATPVITGGGTLTVSTANAIGIFRLVFSSSTVAKLYRIG